MGEAPKSLRAFDDNIKYSAALKQALEEKRNAKFDMLKDPKSYERNADIKIVHEPKCIEFAKFTNPIVAVAAG